MAHDHAHGSGSRRQLRIVFGIVATIFVFQLIGSVVTGSLALLIDTGHNAVDLIGIGIALFAASLVSKPTGGQKTWGFRRAEVFAAGAQATLLLGLGVYSLIEGIRRFFVPPEVPGPGLLLFGAIGLVGNLVSIVILSSSKEDSLNLKAAFLEVIADALGSVAVILAALAIWLFGWERADAVAALVIAALIVPRAFAILRETGSILLEEAPKELDLDKVREHLEAVEHVQEVHDLHITRIDSNLPVLTAHVVLADECFYDGHAPRILKALQECLTEHHKIAIEHSTFQFDRAKDAAEETHTHD
ncbi:cation diffusion facilitator family transporter [Brevibacterium linens]|uniref:Cobalt-zinc-cadmium efflux system protein n=1 Tax=Brevibacterium linens ATCC 9172 TaxID=1255617 RepID=A0A2H1IRC0_BRELN|nr:cation diffusion facilitator family transporter [Brevibacterium linens]KAB1948881.1 cation transporter [Brevibacterium linens ATCC 9172]SMX77698.1 cobalt-zinc-cadmium efflux system protein [Brevibacterium linens ATCC 9172]